ncbi:hypothetical protein [Serratia fonticola]|uniref:hypothetical protein n=1 Tax=Serratia fonticola TaxID=47917 RepID=UPI0021BD0B6F|nr:hypothetical protein [Serratia fonticola]
MNVLQLKLVGINMNVRIFFLFFFIAIIVFLSPTFFMMNGNLQEEKTCLSTVKYRIGDDNDSLIYTIYYRIFFRGSGTGYVDIRGVVKKDKNEYVLARNLIFNYSVQKDNTHFDAKIHGVTKTGQDNVPDLIVERYLAYIIPDKISYFRLDEIGQGRLLLSASQGPFLICSGVIQ